MGCSWDVIFFLQGFSRCSQRGYKIWREEIETVKLHMQAIKKMKRDHLLQ